MGFCPACGASDHAGGTYCAQCGARLAVPVADALPQPTAYAPDLSRPVGPPPVTQGMAIAALLLNILIWPGLGSLVAGRSVGWAQGFLFLGGVILAIVLIGIPMLIGAWIMGARHGDPTHPDLDALSRHLSGRHDVRTAMTNMSAEHRNMRDR